MSAAVATGEAGSGAIVAAEEAPVDRTKHPSGIVPQLQNVVATVDLGCKLELKDIALHARNAEYNPKVDMLQVAAACWVPACRLLLGINVQKATTILYLLCCALSFGCTCTPVMIAHALL